jgi:uncharacterized integral membrane protein (TIGR00697 family)
MRRYKYLDTLTLGFVVVLLISNLVGPKIYQIHLGHFANVSGAQLLFPITYIFGDVCTEIYGYAASRRAIWLGFFATLLLDGMGELVVSMPSAPSWQNQHAFEVVFGLVPRFAVASLAAYWMGEFTNSYTLAKLKILTKGRWLWTRTIGSTITGQFVDTIIVILIAFWGSPSSLIRSIIISSYLTKVAYEVIATPLTYAVVGFLKKKEGADAFDTHSNFNPFAITNTSVEAPNAD